MTIRNGNKRENTSRTIWIITALLTVLLAFLFADTMKKERMETARLEELFKTQVTEEKQQMQEEQEEINARLEKEQNDSFYQKLADGFDVRILVTGGSIANGRGSTDAEHTWHALLKKHIQDTYGITAEVDNISMNDNTAYAGYVNIRNHESEKPYDLVIVSYGEDDPAANFGLYYEAVIRSAMEKYPDASVLCIPESLTGTPTANTGAVEDICEAYGITAAPSITVFAGTGLLNDNGYPNNAGQEAIMQAVADALDAGAKDYRGKEAMPAERFDEASAYLDAMHYYPADLFTREGNTFTYTPDREISGKVLGMDYDYVTGYNSCSIYITGQWGALGQAVFNNTLTYEDTQTLNSSGRQHLRVMNNWISDWGTYDDQLFTITEQIMISFAEDDTGTRQADSFRGIIVSGQE
ncbi:MAG: SGNH/GDSL hydrolase family protein [Erysipelotrichaceae bacterium]|nr:SGNH/GDSL hydrolase family protein [Erysipelotrichaceae bacterium]